MSDRNDPVLEILLDRRQVSRGLVQADAMCRVGADSFFGTARDLSEEGLFIETAGAPEIGHKVAIELSFRAYPIVLRLRGEVARVKARGGEGAQGIGIRLLGLDSAARKELRSWFSADSES